jgi:hypothetical protein
LLSLCNNENSPLGCWTTINGTMLSGRSIRP